MSISLSVIFSFTECSCLLFGEGLLVLSVTWGVFFQILGNVSEFQRVVSVLQEGVNFDIDVNASVFETNIRGK